MERHPIQLRLTAVSVVIPRLEKVDPVVADEINDAVFLCQPARLGSGSQVLERLGLSDPGKRIAKNRHDQVQCPKRDLSIGLDPVLEIFSELRLKNGGAARRAVALLIAPSQVRSPVGAWRPAEARPGVCEPAPVRPSAVVRSREIEAGGQLL
jgi:hypothetical protein